MSNRRMAHGVAALGEHLYACGGHSSLAATLSCERYDIAANSWASIASLPTEVTGTLPVDMRNTNVDNKMVGHAGFVFAFIGWHWAYIQPKDEMWRYTPASDTWTSFPLSPGSMQNSVPLILAIEAGDLDQN